MFSCCRHSTECSRPPHVFWTLDSRAIAAIITAGFAFPIAMIALGAIIACNRMFVAPIMYVRGSLFWPAWREFWTAIVLGHIWSLTLLFAMHALFGLAFIVIAFLAMCLTCCLAALPYVSSVVLLPALVFLRCYSICYLEQFGSEYTILSYEPSWRGFEVIMPPSPSASPGPPPTPPTA